MYFLWFLFFKKESFSIGNNIIIGLNMTVQLYQLKTSLGLFGRKTLEYLLLP